MFEELFVPDSIREAVSDRAWVAGTLEFEAQLAAAEAELSVIPPEAAATITDGCDPEHCRG